MTSANRSNAELRRFGFVMTGAWTFVAALLAWRGRGAWPVAAALAVLFGALALAAPRLLRPVEKAWMHFAAVMSAVSTFVILVLGFFLVITPLGLVMRLAGARPLQLKRDPAALSYWTPVEPDGGWTRPDKPY